MNVPIEETIEALQKVVRQGKAKGISQVVWSPLGVELTDDVIQRIGDALGDIPIRRPTLAPFAVEGVRHR